MTLPIEIGELTCEHCGTHYFYDQQQHCWKCDQRGCPDCITAHPQPLCPECCGNQFPEDLAPMLASTGALPHDPHQWGFEFKWDGMRALCYWDGARISLQSRNLRTITSGYPELRDLGAYLPNCPMILDGEIVALDAAGKPSFARLQQRMHLTDASAVRNRVPIYYYIFDLLVADGHDVRDRGYQQRRELLSGLRLEHPACRIPPSYSGAGAAMLSTAERFGLEGVMAKRLDSPYTAARRSKLWRKIKLVKQQEFVIIGWTAQRHASNRVGALLLGYYNDAMLLVYAGSVGSGFGDRDHQYLLEHLQALEQQHWAVAPPPARHGATAVAPKLVAQVQYRRWPPGGLIQHAAYKGLRVDKSSTDVQRETME